MSNRDQEHYEGVLDHLNEIAEKFPGTTSALVVRAAIVLATNCLPPEKCPPGYFVLNDQVLVSFRDDGAVEAAWPVVKIPDTMGNA